MWAISAAESALSEVGGDGSAMVKRLYLGRVIGFLFAVMYPTAGVSPGVGPLVNLLSIRVGRAVSRVARTQGLGKSAVWIAW